MSKARNSPLRDYMLELHKRGVKVVFYEGRPEIPDDKSQMFFVDIPKGYTIEEHVEILAKINEAIRKSAEMTKGDPPAKLTRQVAAQYVSRLKMFNEDAGRNK